MLATTRDMSTAEVKVLLVEDTLSDAELLMHWLRRVPVHHFSITHAQSWSDTLELIRRETFDVLLLDLSLPDSKGLETILRARAAVPHMPIIVMTGNEDEAIALEAARHGIEDYLVKDSTDSRGIARAIRYAVESSRACEALSRSREMLHAISEGTSDPVYAKDLSGRYLLANAAAAHLVGKEAEEIIGREDAQFFTPEEAGALRRVDNSAMARDRAQVFEERLTDPAGEQRIFLSTKGPLRDAAGNTTGVFGISHDVTELKRTEKHLQGVAALLNLFATESSRKEYLAAVIKLLRDWCDCECVGLRLADGNGALPFAAQVGFGRSFLQHERQLSLATGDCACMRVLTGRIRSADAGCVSRGGSLFCNHTSRSLSLLGGRPGKCDQIACVNAGYESLAQAPLRYRGLLIGSLQLCDSRPDKFPAHVMVFVEAAALLIGEAIHRLKIEESLVESEARFRSMFERHASVMLLADPKTGAIVDVNSAGAAFYGYTADQLRLMKIVDLLAWLPDAAAITRTRRPRAIQQRSPWVGLHRLARGEARMVEAHFSPIQVQGRKLLFYIIHDVTERTVLQKQVLEVGERERQRIGQDLHDSLGGKLTGAALMAKALAQRLKALGLAETDLAQEVVQCVNESIGQTRAIARGLYPLNLRGGGLAGALAEFVAETERRSGIRCHFHADDAFRIEQPVVALHLFRLALEAVNNAVRHAEARNISVRLVAAPTHLALEVHDDGKGLTDRADSGGLGLQTMQYRAESIGGHLAIRPSDTGGTTVSCLLPLDRAEDHTWQL